MCKCEVGFSGMHDNVQGNGAEAEKCPHALATLLALFNNAKLGHLQRASNYSYTEEEVRAKVQQQAQREGAVLTTRQKLAMQAAQAAGTARPKKMMRNVLGQAIVQDYD